FFSSRRRHTRFSRDWSSDVCSSDLSLAHTSTSLPASAVGAGVKVKATESVVATQPPLPVLVRKSHREPLAISEALGVYTAPRLFALGEKVPAPPLHVPPVAPVTVPASWMAALLAQRVCAAPASTTGAGVMMMVA